VSIIILLCGLALLLFLIIGLQFNAFIALIVVTIFVGLGVGMDLISVLKSLQKGMGDTLGSLAMVLGFGVMLGKILSETGAIQRISSGMINSFGVKNIKLALVLTGFVVGIAMFYNAGFVVLIPLVFTVAAQTNLPLIYIGIPMASALSVTHGFLPPHPGPSSIAVLFHADIGKVLIYGVIVAIPTLFVAGLLFPNFLKKIPSSPPTGIFSTKIFTNEEMPSFVLSLIVALIPVLLMAAGSAADFIFQENSQFKMIFHFIGDPGIALLIAVVGAVFLLKKNQSMEYLMKQMSESVGSIALIFLIIGAGGAFKQVLIDTGLGKEIALGFKNSNISPLFLGWLIALLIRVALGSATVAGLTAAGIVQPMLSTLNVNPELMVLSIGAGSLMCSHVNDTGFWMFKEYFGLTVKDTFKSWTIMETIVGISGLIGVLLLNIFV